MAQTIKLGADTVAFKQAIMGLQRDFQTLGKKAKISLFDQGTKNLIAGGAKRAITDMLKEVQRLEKANKDIEASLRKQANTEADISKAQSQQIKNLKEISGLRKDIARTGEAADELTGGGGNARKRFGQGAMRLMGRVPGLGGLSRMMGAGGLAGLAGAGIVGAGAFGVSRAMSGFNAFDANKESRVNLMGRGFRGTDTTGVNANAQGVGLSSAETRELQLQATDAFGRRGATADKIAGTARTATSLGISAGELQGVGSRLGSSLGRQGGEKAFEEFKANLVATKLDGAIGPYLESMVSLLTDINKDGLGLNTAAMAALSTLSEGGEISPERAAASLGGISGAMKGATGDRAAFFQSALAGRGLGGGTIGGSQLRMEMGLFGGNADALDSEMSGNSDFFKQTLGGLRKNKVIGGNDMFTQTASAIVDQFKNMGKDMGPEQRAMLSNKLLGTQGEEGIRRMADLERIVGSEGPDRDKRIAELQQKMRPAEEVNKENLSVIKDSAAEQLKISQAILQTEQEELGSRIAPAAIMTNNFLANIDANIAKLLGFFGMGGSSIVDKGKKGDISLEEFKGLGSQDQGAIRSELLKKQSMLGDSLQTGSYAGTPMSGEMQKKVQQDWEKVTGLLGQIAKHTLQTSRGTNKPSNTQIKGNVVPGKG